ncbi:hypothetical protein PG995_004837 [Apiospora arundinis]
MPTTASVWKAGSPQTTWSARYVGSLWLVTVGNDGTLVPVKAEIDGKVELSLGPGIPLRASKGGTMVF